jgi:hypothetical protein
MARLPLRLPMASRLVLAILVNFCLANSASAHVKWFCAFDIAGQPLGLENVLCPDFEILIAMSILALLSGGLLELTVVGEAMLRSLDRVTAFVRQNSEVMLRAATGFFFISIWAVGGILLTPELKTNSTAVAILHLGIAAGMLSRRTLPISALAMVCVFDIALWNYGAFHLADYPVFLGVAAYLALTGAQQTFFGIKPLDIARWSAGVTLMWASIEKWAYPEWSYPLFVQHPGLSLGFSPEFYMRAAGAVEFALAFALVWTPLVRRAGALMLLPMFIGAVLTFGKVDLIGHTLIVAVLLAIAAESVPARASARECCAMPVAYAGSLVVFFAAYYLMHSALFGTPVL